MFVLKLFAVLALFTPIVLWLMNRNTDDNKKIRELVTMAEMDREDATRKAVFWLQMIEDLFVQAYDEWVELNRENTRRIDLELMEQLVVLRHGRFRDAYFGLRRQGFNLYIEDFHPRLGMEYPLTNIN